MEARRLHGIVSATACLAMLGLSCPVASAQTAQRPDLRPGDRWQFAVYYTVPSATPSRFWVIESVTAEGIRATENGEPLVIDREMNVLESPRDRSSDPAMLRFPLEVGKKWRIATDWHFKAKGSSGKFAGDAAVVAYEKVRVPAGEFDAFRLVSTRRVSGTSPIGSQYNADITSTYWYAPAARAIVKSVTHNPYLGPSTVELVGMQLQP